jgi:hypothetical protein
VTPPAGAAPVLDRPPVDPGHGPASLGRLPPRRRPLPPRAPLSPVGREQAITGPLRVVRPAGVGFRPASAAMAVGWAVLLVAAAIAGAPALAVLTGPVASVAAISGLRAVARGRPAGSEGGRASARGRRAGGEGGGGQAVRGEGRLGDRGAPAAALGAGLLALLAPFAALAGAPLALVAVAAAAVLAAGLAGRLGIDPRRAAVAAAGPALAAASIVLCRQVSTSACVALVFTVCLYDAASYLMGNGRPTGWPGAVAGVATAVVGGFLVAALADPPFRGPTPWLFTVGAALLCVAGARTASWVVRQGRAPALLRLDAFLVSAPMWALLATVALAR